MSLGLKGALLTACCLPLWALVGSALLEACSRSLREEGVCCVVVLAV